MKRLWLGAGLLMLFLGMGIGLSFVFHRIHAPMAQQLAEASSQALSGNWEQALALAEDAGARWEASRNFTAAVADHAPLEEMDALFSQLEIYAALNWQGEFSALCMQLSKMAAAMEESQALTWWTML